MNGLHRRGGGRRQTWPGRPTDGPGDAGAPGRRRRGGRQPAAGRELPARSGTRDHRRRRGDAASTKRCGRTAPRPRSWRRCARRWRREGASRCAELVGQAAVVVRQAGSVAVTVSVMVAGVDVGNHTTEIVLARVGRGTVEQVAHGHAPTRGRKGSKESLEGAAALLHKMEVDAAVAADELLLAALRPVDTATAPLPPPSSPRSPVRSLRRPATPTHRLERASGVGRHVPLADLAGGVIDGPAIVSVDSVDRLRGSGCGRSRRRSTAAGTSPG